MTIYKLHGARLVVTLTVLLALSGCTLVRPPVDIRPEPTEPSAAAETTPIPMIPSTPTSTPGLLCTPKRDLSKGQISGEYQQVPVDSGPRIGATGKVLLDHRGVPVAYLVAANDIPDFVADRFCVGLAYLNNINGPRRGGAMDLFAGDTLNLDAETLTTVGDINGEVEDYPSLPAPLPPQHEPDF